MLPWCRLLQCWNEAWWARGIRLRFNQGVIEAQSNTAQSRNAGHHSYRGKLRDLIGLGFRSACLWTGYRACLRAGCLGVFLGVDVVSPFAGRQLCSKEVRRRGLVDGGSILV